MAPSTKPWNTDFDSVDADEAVYTDFKDQEKKTPCSVKFKTKRVVRWLEKFKLTFPQCIEEEKNDTVTLRPEIIGFKTVCKFHLSTGCVLIQGGIKVLDHVQLKTIPKLLELVNCSESVKPKELNTSSETIPKEVLLDLESNADSIDRESITSDYELRSHRNVSEENETRLKEISPESKGNVSASEDKENTEKIDTAQENENTVENSDNEYEDIESDADINQSQFLTPRKHKSRKSLSPKPRRSMQPFRDMVQSLQLVLCNLTDRMDNSETKVSTMQDSMVSECQKVRDEIASIKSTVRCQKSQENSQLEDIELSIRSQAACNQLISNNLEKVEAALKNQSNSLNNINKALVQRIESAEKSIENGEKTVKEHGSRLEEIEEKISDLQKRVDEIMQSTSPRPDPENIPPSSSDNSSVNSNKSVPQKTEKESKQSQSKNNYLASTTKETRGNKFKAWVFDCDSYDNAHRLYNKVKEDEPNADHYIFAFNTKNDGIGFHHDGEKYADMLLKNLLTSNNLQNTLVIVARWVNSVHIGEDRFKLIEQCALEALKTAFPEKTFKTKYHTQVQDKQRPAFQKGSNYQNNDERSTLLVHDSVYSDVKRTGIIRNTKISKKFVPKLDSAINVLKEPRGNRENIIIGVGANDMRYPVNDISDKFSEVCEAAIEGYPRANIFCCAVTPSTKVDTSKVREVNQNIKDTCDSHPQIQFIDTFTPIFANPASDVLRDGLHPNELGSNILSQTLATAVNRPRKPMSWADRVARKQPASEFNHSPSARNNRSSDSPNENVQGQNVPLTHNTASIRNPELHNGNVQGSSAPHPPSIVNVRSHEFDNVTAQAQEQHPRWNMQYTYQPQQPIPMYQPNLVPNYNLMYPSGANVKYPAYPYI